MAIDPRVRWLVKIARALDRTSDDIPMAQRRAQSASVARRLGRLVMPGGPKSVRSVDELVPVADGRITVRVHRSEGRTELLPLHVFLHGGGWCLGTLDERDPRCRAVAEGAGCVVASVDYRLAPEHRYPTAPEDCYAALCWLVEHAERLRIDPERISIGGESAGANLAAVVCLMARDRSGPALKYQWLDVPATDLTLSQPSHRDLPDGYLLDHAEIITYRDNYLAEPSQATEPYASPLLAGDLSGLPSAWIMTCGYDHLRDDGAAYAARLADAGVPARHIRLEGHVHPSFAFTRLVPSARAYEQDAIAALRAALA